MEIKDILALCVSLAALIISLYSLGIWRKQLKTQNELDAAKKILKCLYLLENDYRKLRTIKIQDWETNDFDYINSNSNSSVEITKYAYKKRISGVEKNLELLNDVVLEGKIYWDKCTEFYSSISANVNIVVEEIERYLDVIYQKTPEEISEIDSKIIRNNNLDIDKNVYESINKFEIYLKQYVLVEKN